MLTAAVLGEVSVLRPRRPRPPAAPPGGRSPTVRLSSARAVARACRSLLLAGLVLLLAVRAEAAERRVALVVGASAYRAVPLLRNTLNDARGLAASLGRLGFEVESTLDPDRSAFEAAVRRFGTRARGADVALFFYAGHAVESNGRNWLLPVSADIRGGRDLRYEAIDLDGVLEQLDGAARLAVIMLDSCRDNPFRMRLGEGGRGLDRGGLAQVQAAAGTLVVFSTAPGTVAADGTGPNSPFTTALLKRIETPGVEFRQVLAEVRRDVREATKGKQVPWEQSAVEGTLYLKPAPEPAPAAKVEAPPAPAPIRPSLDPETLFWDSVRNSHNPDELKAYLARYPNGIFADLARTRLSGLQAPAAPVADAAGSPAERLIKAMPAVAASVRERLVPRYLEQPASKAMAISLERGEMHWSTGWPNGAKAEEAALEVCQVKTGEPCVPFAIEAELHGPGPTGDWVRRDMPRARYAGPYDPAQIPKLRDPARASAMVTGYGVAPEPKAMAWHNWGRVFAAAGAASEVAAEEQALAACNQDPDRHGQDGPCMLYAIGTRVVLPQTLTAPASLADADFAARLAAALPMRGQERADVARQYAVGRESKAMAIVPERRNVWFQTGWSTPELAETITLEKCQIYYGTPCELFARNRELFLGDRSRRDMPRVRYAGRFDAAQLPALSGSVRARADLASYGGAAGPKAIALHPAGYAYVVTGAASQAEAETGALTQCNAEPARKGQWGPCFLYAVGDTVVLVRRYTAPVSTGQGPKRSIADEAVP